MKQRIYIGQFQTEISLFFLNELNSSKYAKQLLFAQKENAGWLLIKV